MWKTASSRVLVVISGVLLLACGLVAAGRSSTDPLNPASWTSGPGAKPTPQRLRAEIPTDRTLQADDFRSDLVGANPPAGWEASGTWKGVTEDGGHVLSHSAGSTLGTMLTGSADWSSYQVAVNVKVTTPRTGFAGLVGRYQTSGDYYECVIHHDESVQLWRIRNGQGMELAGKQLAVAAGRPHRLALSLQGGSITCGLDRVIVAAATDGALPVGRPGLIASSGESAEFGDVMVTVRVPAGSTPAPDGGRSTPAAPASSPSGAPTSAPSASPAPLVTPSASPSAGDSNPAFVRAPQAAAPGSSASVVVRTTPGAVCSASLANPVAAAQAAGLGVKAADGQGTVNWNWNVGAATPRGALPVWVTCAGTTVQTTVNIV